MRETEASTVCLTFFYETGETARDTVHSTKRLIGPCPPLDFLCVPPGHTPSPHTGTYVATRVLWRLFVLAPTQTRIVAGQVSDSSRTPNVHTEAG